MTGISMFVSSEYTFEEKTARLHISAKIVYFEILASFNTYLPI